MGCFFILFFIFLFLSSPVSARTPGDAALWGGHPQQAAELYKRGAELGDKTAAFNLGVLISQGQVTEQDFGKASLWYEMACQSGHIVACHNMGVACEYGSDGISKDFSKAHQYYLTAAEKGFVFSQYNLASLYSNNYLKPRNNLEGYKWMLIARDNAGRCQGEKEKICQWILEDPPGHMSKLKKRLSKTQIEQAEALAKAWKVKK